MGQYSPNNRKDSDLQKQPVLNYPASYMYVSYVVISRLGFLSPAEVGNFK